MSINRSREDQGRYKKYQALRTDMGCDFCAIEKGDDQHVSETLSFKIVRNRFPYSIWDEQRVTGHLMIIPKQHVDSLTSLTPKQAVEYLEIVGEYEQKGYNVYARGHNSLARTRVHQHTHLIRTEGRPKRLVVLARKPYLVVAW